MPDSSQKRSMNCFVDFSAQEANEALAQALGKSASSEKNGEGLNRALSFFEN